MNQTLAEQANKSLNLTSPALRGGQRSGAVKRAPQVSSSPLGGLIKHEEIKMSNDIKDEFAIAAYGRLVEEKHHYDNLSWLIGGIVLAFAGALIAYTPTMKADNYAIQVLIRLIPTLLVWILLGAWYAIYQRNRMWGEAANEAMRDIEAQFRVRGAGTVFRECALSNEVVLKNIDWDDTPIVIKGRPVLKRIEKPKTGSIHNIMGVLIIVAAIIALGVAFIR